MNIEQKLRQTVQEFKENDIQEANLKAKMIIAHVLKIKRQQLLIENKKELKDEQIQKINEIINKIIQGKPIQYVLNNQEFMGMNFYVNENVLIPQPDTEILVEEAINIVKNKMSNNDYNQIKILDLCTGSGAIAISLAKILSSDAKNNKTIDPKITATDISLEALEIANINTEKNQIEEKVEFIKSDMFENISGKFHMIVSNPPYIETNTIKTLSKEVRHEPMLALDGGEDGLDFYKIIAKEAYKYLNKDGYLIVEIGYNQKQEVVELFEKTNKYKNIKCKKDFSNNDRIIICSLK